MKKTTAVLVLLALCLMLFAGCGSKTDSAAKESEFLLGTWIAREASYNGETRDPYDIFNGMFSLHFSKDGKCTMAIDQNRALVDWELTDSGVTLKGDSTYQITFPDESRKTMIAVINGVDVLLEKYEE